MSDDEVVVDGMLIDELHVRRWFMLVGLEQARDTMNICRGIVDGRVSAEPKRKRRSDAGEKRQGRLTEQMEKDGTFEKPDIR